MTLENEVGRELRANELKPRQIVAIKAPDRPALMTMWVVQVRDNLVVFYSGTMNWHVVNLVRDDGSLIDDQGRVVHVFEYLGEL